VLTALLLAVLAAAVSLLTFFAGFGLGTLLMPAFALFLPLEIAVAATAIVHFANNVFKALLLARHARRDILVRFGLPAVGAAFAGAALLGILSTEAPLTTWSPFGRPAVITPIKLVLGVLIVAFGLFELVPALRSFRASPRYLPLGGVLAGFFGGLSGHQGALRAAFLSPLGLTPVQFTATQALLGLMVDVARLIVYAATFLAAGSTSTTASIPWGWVAAATAGALAGALLGKALLPKVTVERLHLLTGVLLVLVGTALALGIV
jgi:uncharacterized membrane protein YfcA